MVRSHHVHTSTLACINSCVSTCRAGPPDYPGGDDAWRAMRMQEPPNAHSHVIQFVVGTSEAIPIHKGKMTIGTFQNIIVVDADGPAGALGSPKTRTICVQVQGSDEVTLHLLRVR